MVNICYTGDEGYVIQIATSMISVLENNPETEIRFFILGDAYSKKTIDRFRQIQDKYGREIRIIDITPQMHLLDDTVLYQEPDIGKNGLITFMFARLFIDSALPADVNKVLYIDGDTVILGRVQELFDTILKDNYVVGAIRDIWPVTYNKAIGHELGVLYFMSGLLLIDLNAWREQRIEQQILDHVHKLSKKYFMHDQDVINVCLQGKIDTLPLKWGMIYIIRAYSPEQILWFCGKTEETFYTKKEIDKAKTNVTLIHYAGDYYGRPWVFPHACEDSRIWYKYYQLTPWKNEKLNYVKCNKQRIVYIAKRVLEKPLKNYWLKRTKGRFEKINYKAEEL